MADPILDEIWRVRQELVKKHGGIDGYFRHIQKLDRARRKTRRLRHKKAVQRVVFSPDGKLLASLAYRDAVRLWERDSGKERCALPKKTPRGIRLPSVRGGTTTGAAAGADATATGAGVGGVARTHGWRGERDLAGTEIDG